MSGISFWSLCFQCVIWVGCTPYVLANSLTVLSPLTASKATRALNSALYRFRCVDISSLLLHLILTQHSIFITCPVFGVHYTSPCITRHTPFPSPLPRSTTAGMPTGWSWGRPDYTG